MAFGQAQGALLQERGETKLEAAERLHIDNSTLGKYINGSRKPPKDLMRRSVEQYDDPVLTLAAHEEVAGDASVPYLNNADLHPSTVQLKTIEEVSEADAAIRAVPITKRKDQLCEKDMTAIRTAIVESIEAITALTHYVAVLCKAYAFSWLAMWKEHRAKLKASKYVK